MAIHPRLKPFIKKLETGSEARVAFFGDSITAVHYHTGSRIAYPEMTGKALQMLYAKANLKVINAGVSGNKTTNALERMQADVLDHSPDLVSIMFGMNDQTLLSTTEFAQNLCKIADACRGIGAEILFCTQNNMREGEDLGARDNPKLARFTQTIHEVAEKLDAPVADCHRVFEDLRETDERAWRLLLLNPFHPGLHGHRLFTRLIVETITGKLAPPESIANTHPSIPHALEVAGRTGELSVTLLGVTEDVVHPGLELILPHTEFSFTSRDISSLSLPELVAEDCPATEEPLGDLVFACLPVDAGELDDHAYVYSAELIKRRILPFSNKPGVPKRDAAFILPSVLDAGSAKAFSEREAAHRLVAAGGDCGCIRRPTDNTKPASELVSNWLTMQTQPHPAYSDDFT